MTIISISSRRDLLKTGGALVVSFSFFGARRASARASGRAAKPVAPPRSIPSSPSMQRRHVTVYSGKVDLGTGVRIAMAKSWPKSSTFPSAASLSSKATRR